MRLRMSPLIKFYPPRPVSSRICKITESPGTFADYPELCKQVPVTIIIDKDRLSNDNTSLKCRYFGMR